MQVCGVHLDGGMRNYLSVPNYSLIKGDGLSFEELALIEPLAIGAHSIQRAGVKKDEFVLVIGAGPIGLGIMEFARIAGGKCDCSRCKPATTCFLQRKIEGISIPSTLYQKTQLKD